MKLRLLATSLAVVLLLSALGCSKKEDATPDATGSYRLDNALVGCQSKASISTGTGSGNSLDYLTIDLVSAPQPSTGAETLRLYFVKPSTPAGNTYTLNGITLQDKGNTLPYYFSVDVATLSTTNSGGFSGTFSGKIINSPGSPAAPYTTIADGKFTNVHP